MPKNMNSNNYIIELIDLIDERWNELQKFEQVTALHKYIIDTVPHIVKGGGLYLANTVKWMRWIKLFRYILEKTEVINYSDGYDIYRRDLINLIKYYYDQFKIDLDKFNNMFYPLDLAIEYIDTKFISEEENEYEYDKYDEYDKYYEYDEYDEYDLPPLEKDEEPTQSTNFDSIDLTLSRKSNSQQISDWEDSTLVPWKSTDSFGNWEHWTDTSTSDMVTNNWDDNYYQIESISTQSLKKQNSPDLFEPLEPFISKKVKKSTFPVNAIQIAKRFEYIQDDLIEFQMSLVDLYNANYINEKIDYLIEKITPV